MTREEELRQLNKFIKKNGVTVLPKDERGPEIVISSWTRRKPGRPKKKRNVSKK
jgi:hypothetical protein